MYTGDEKFINNNVETNYSMLNFWQWTLSCIHDSTTRGSLAEYIVKLALDVGGYELNPDGKTGMDPFDLYGPIIKSTGKYARIEVKSTGYFRINPLTGLTDTKTHMFSIAKKSVPDEHGDYKDNAPRIRHNDIYVFVVYNGRSPEENVLDLSLWDFYVLPTFILNSDPVYCDRVAIPLSVIQDRCDRLSFDEVSAAIASVCDSINTE